MRICCESRFFSELSRATDCSPMTRGQHTGHVVVLLKLVLMWRQVPAAELQSEHLSQLRSLQA